MKALILILTLFVCAEGLLTSVETFAQALPVAPAKCSEYVLAKFHSRDYAAITAVLHPSFQWYDGQQRKIIDRAGFAAYCRDLHAKFPKAVLTAGIPCASGNLIIAQWECHLGTGATGEEVTVRGAICHAWDGKGKLLSGAVYYSLDAMPKLPVNWGNARVRSCPGGCPAQTPALRRATPVRKPAVRRIAGGPWGGPFVMARLARM